MKKKMLPEMMKVLLSDVDEERRHVDFCLAERRTPSIEKETEVIVEMVCAPINPSDIGVIFGPSRRLDAWQHTATCVRSPIDAEFRRAFEKDQYGNSRKGGIVCGNEGSGVVVAAGAHPSAQALLGKTVSVFGSGGCYASYRKVSALGNSVNPMPPGITPQQCASAYVNPLTVLGMLHTAGGSRAIVHTAAASQLGQMMQRVCLKDKIPLVNIVRRKEQESILLAINPQAIVVNQTSPTFKDDLVRAIIATGAAVAFDATGGGSLSSDILNAFDRAGVAKPDDVEYQLYHYGALDTSPSTLTDAQRERVSFWLLPMWASRQKQAFSQGMLRVREEITSTFSTHYTAEIGLVQAVSVDALRVYARQETGKKYLLNHRLNSLSKL